MISKELLSNVLDEDINGVFYYGDNLLYFEHFHKNHYVESHTNIHELAHKCKEWAFSRGYEILSYTSKDGGCYVEKDTRGTIDTVHEELDLNQTEAEAIFKACEWILEQL